VVAASAAGVLDDVSPVVFGVAPEPPVPSLAASPDPPPPAASPPAFEAWDLPADAEAERSFFAQPEPLKWTADVVMPLLIVPSAPHSGQNFGPASWMPWITSVTVRQRAQL
jgi:hypothetical protein